MLIAKNILPTDEERITLMQSSGSSLQVADQGRLLTALSSFLLSKFDSLGLIAFHDSRSPECSADFGRYNQDADVG